MSKLFAAVVAVGSLTAAGGAFAQSCTSLPNTQVSPVTFEQAITAFSGSGAALVKDEFETTAQFEARRAAAGAGPTSMVVSLPIDPAYVTYNADAGAFEIKSFAVANIGNDWFTTFYGSPYFGTIATASYDNLAIVLSNEDTNHGSYEAKNGYGATWQVTNVNRHVDTIFESKPPRYGVSLFGNESMAAPVWSLPVPVDQAREFKSKLRAAVVIVPKAPFYFENTQQSQARITVQNPRDIKQISRVIVADIQCVVFTDDANNVLLSVTTN